MVAGGRPSPELTGQDVNVRRSMLFDFWRWACGYPETDHVDEGHPRYELVTEGRDFGAGYSSCADLAHGGYWQVGDRRRWLNRGAAWRVGVNVSRVVSESGSWRGDVDPGDVLVIANDWPGGRDAHVVCVLERRLAEGGLELVTAEYGQPGGAIKRRRVYNGVMGGRRVRMRMAFDVEIRKAFHTGLLVDPRSPA